jgi:hypothetical protein
MAASPNPSARPPPVGTLLPHLGRHPLWCTCECYAQRRRKGAGPVGQHALLTRAAVRAANSAAAPKSTPPPPRLQWTLPHLQRPLLCLPSIVGQPCSVVPRLASTAAAAQKSADGGLSSPAIGGKVAAHAGKADVVWGDDDPWMRLGGWRLGIRFFTALWCVREAGLPSIF